MSEGFREGYEYFTSHAGAALAAFDSNSFMNDRIEYINAVDDAIAAFEKDINSFQNDNTVPSILKGKIAEFWHADTFNINAAINQSANRAEVLNSNEFASVDISTNFDQDYGLKYYSTAQNSAKHQAESVLERFMEYKAKGGKDDLVKYLSDRKYDISEINNPVYKEQMRLIPSDQLQDAIKWLERKIASEGAARPDQVERYQETLAMLRDRIADNEGNESVPLSAKDAEKIAAAAEEGKFKAEDFDIESPELLNEKLLVTEALKAGLSAALISLVLRIGQEILETIDYLIKNGEIDEEQFRKIGFDALEGSAEGFVRGSIAASITMACKAEKLGKMLSTVDPAVVGTIVAITMNIMKSALNVAIGKKTRTKLTEELIRDMFVASSSLLAGRMGQAVLKNIPVLGYLVGSFVGSVAGSFLYNTGYKAVLSFCTETGITMFGLVEQDYKLPDDIIEEMGLETFEYETFDYETFEPDTFEPDSFEPDTIEPDSIGIKFIRRGVIGVSKIGYVE